MHDLKWFINEIEITRQSNTKAIRCNDQQIVLLDSFAFFASNDLLINDFNDFNDLLINDFNDLLINIIIGIMVMSK